MSLDPSPEKARFAWPPVRPPVQILTELAPVEPTDDTEFIRPPPARATVGFRAALLEFERIWLGLTRPPLTDRIAAADWKPDSPLRYCSRCGSTADPHGAPCGWCSDTKVPWERTIRLGDFKGLLREVVHDVKFSRWRRLGRDVGRMLGEAVEIEVVNAALHRDQTVLVPVPMSLTRRLSRGIDHATVIARGVSEVTGLPLIHALHRRHTRPQAGLGMTARQTNVAGSFTPIRGVNLGGLTVILVDDVTTTRATLRAACKAIALGYKELGVRGGVSTPRIWAAIVAVTPHEAS